MIEKKPCFISINPCGEDLLDGGSQERIADCIKDHIENDDCKSHLIGLEGKWGSGKSNIIEILKNLYEESIQNN